MTGRVGDWLADNYAAVGPEDLLTDDDQDELDDQEERYERGEYDE